MKAKFYLASFLSFAGVLMSSDLQAQNIPAPLTSANFPSVGDSVEVRGFIIPSTQVYDPNGNFQAADSLTLDRTLEKAIQQNNALDGMRNISVPGYRQDTMIVFFYSAQPRPVYKKKYNTYSPFLPGASSFPNANLHAVIPTEEGSANTYFLKNNDGFYELGFQVVTSQGPVVVTNNPPKPVVNFPVTYNTNNVNNFSITSTGGGLTTNTVLNITIDAYGDITIIDGDINNPTVTKRENFLRVVTESEDIVEVPAVGNVNIFTKIFSYYVAGLPEPVAIYSAAKLRSELDPMLWLAFPQLAWQDRIECAYNIPYATTPPSGLTQVEERLFNIFPNPTNGIINFNFDSLPTQNISIEIFDLNGKKVKDTHNTQNNWSIDLSDLNPGIYIVNLNIDGRVFPSRIIKN